MSEQPNFTHRVEPVLEDAATEVQAAAKRLMNRESTDFIGRMGEALMEAEGCIEENDLTTYRENMIELAALALAQAAMCSAPGVSLTQ